MKFIWKPIYTSWGIWWRHFPKDSSTSGMSTKTPKLTWLICTILMMSYWSDSHQTFVISLIFHSIHSTWLLHTNKKTLMNTPIIQDSILGLGGQEESWWGFSGPIYFKLSGCVPYIILDCYTPIKQPSGTLLSSKTPSWDLEDRRSFDGVLVVRFTSNFQDVFHTP